AAGDASAVAVPKGATVVNAKGKYLIPGLWDTEVHFECYEDFLHPLLLAAGVTGIVEAGSQTLLDSQVVWRRQILAGTRVGPPRQILAGQSIDNFWPNSGIPCQRTVDLHVCIADSADAVHYVDSMKTAGADMIRLRGFEGEEAKSIYLGIAAEVRRQGMYF